MMNAARSIIGCLGILVLLAVTIGAKDFCGTERAMAKLTPAQKQQLRRYSVKGSVPANELLLYLHFTGATIRPGFANATGFVSPLVKGTSNVPPPTMTAAQIAETIELVKDDFSPFNIQITTDYNTFLNYPIAFKQIAIISTLPSTIGMSGVSGVSPWVGIGTRLFSNPSFTFASTLGNVPEDVANVISHEVGHGLGLTHQGRFTIGCAFDIEYQPNIGTGPLAFGPLMGEALAPSISNWWSQACTHPVDGGPLHDFSLISNQVVLRPDDVPNVAPGGSASTPFNGVIEKAGDSDLVRVTSGFADFLSVRSSNIDLVASVFATNGTLIGRYIDRDRSGLTFPIPSGASDIRIRPASNANMDAVFMTGRYRLTGLGSGGAINYTAIGDSLAFGTGAGTPASGGYVPRLRNKIATATGQSVTLDNRGNFGIFSSQLLTSVQTDAAMRASLQSADIITFNIGGNDLGLGRLNYRNNACGGADGQDCLRATATSLKANWDATVAELRTLNPDADIRTIDIYYPAVNFDSTQDSFPGDGLNDFQVLNSYLADFNAHVAVTSASNDIKRGHVHEAFNGSGGTNDPIAGGLIAADFTHPNDTGYELIAVKLFETDTVTFALDPEAVTLALGATQQFTRTGGTPPVVFSLVQNQSGGNVDASGLYTAGPNVGIDIVRVTDEDDATADASVRVSSDISCPDANTKVWDGGGDTNNWSEAANWCNNTVPTTHHSIIFNATSIKNLNINTNVTVASANITSLYTGTITQGTSNLNVTFSFTQAGGTFVAGSGSITVGTTHSHAGGTFSGGFGGLDIEGGFDISGGTFNAPMGEAFFGAPYFQVTGGTFNPNGGTIVFDGGLTNFTIPTTFTLNNVTVNKSSSLRFTTNSSTLVVTGTLTLTNGSIENTAAIGTVEAQGNVVMASTYDGGDATLLISGAATRTVTLPAGATMPRLTVNAPNVTIDTSGTGTILFAQPISIQSVTSFTNGPVNFTFNVGFTIGATTNFVPGSGNLTFNSFLSQNAGTFNAGSGTLDVNGGFDISGGTFTAPTGTAFFGAPYFLVTGGTFNPNGGTIVFDDGLTNFTIPTTFTLNNVTVNKTSSLRFITNSSTLVVTGTLTLTNGSIENTAAIGTVEAQGDVVMASTYDGGDANFRFGGSANQTYTNAGGVNPQGTWTIDKSGGVLILASNLILGTSQALNITSGELSQGTAADLRAGTITVGATGRWRNNGTGDITLGGNVANSGEIDIDGTTVSCDEADSILIRSSSAGVQRNWSGTGSFFVQDADVQDQAGTAAITVHAGTNSGNNGGNWTFDPTCAPFVWDGGGATNNWSEAANWRRNLLPLASTVVLFNGTSVKDSVVDTSYSVDGVQVNSGYSGTLSWSGGNILTVGSLGFVQNAGIVLAGVLTVNGNTTISGGEFTSAAAAIKDFNGDLTISNASFTGPSSATTFISGNFNLTTPTSYSPGSSVRFDGGSSTTVTVPSNTQFNLFAIDKTGSASVSITGGSNVIVNGNLFLMDGLLNGDLIEVRGRFDVLTGFDGGNGAVIIQNLPIGQLSTIQSDAVLPQFVTVNSANCNLSVANLAGTVTFQNLTLQNGTIAASSTLASSIIVIGNYSQSGGTFSYGSFAGQSMTVNGDFSLIGGIFRPLSASLVDLNGDVTLTGGTFTANSGDLTIAANFSRSGSNTFNHNGGRVIFDGSTDRNLSLPDVPFTTVFNDVRFDSPNSTFIDSSVSTFTAFITAGELEFADGFVVSAPARSIVEARGDVVIGGGLDNGISTTIKFGGNAAQSFTDNGGFESFDFTLDKSGGTVNLLSDLDLAVALNDQTLDLANGTITTGANRVIVGGDDTLINGNGFVVGNLEQQFTTGTSTVFNVGTADGPSPVTVNVIAAAANVMGGGPASLTISATQGIRPGMHPLMSVGRFWTITETGDITADLTFNYPQGDANGNEALFGLFRWNGTTNTAVTGNLDTVANTFFTAGVSEFSDWTIGTLVPTAAPASISGRVTDPFGRGLRGVVILAQGSDGVTRSAVTNTFGHYKVEGLAAGQTCVLSASSRRYSFANNFRLVDLSADVSNEDFVATR